MPYRYAWIWLTVLMAITVYAFWPSYLSNLSGASFEFHAHGIPSTLWLILLTVQSWSIHAGRRDLHRRVGVAMVALFPAFLAGGMLISVGMAKRFVEGSIFYEMYAARTAPVDAVAVIGIAWLTYQGLRNRHKVHQHARYMLASIFFLLGAIFNRVLTAIGPFQIAGEPDYYLLAHVFRLTGVMTLGGLAYLAWRAPKHARPWIETAGFIALQMLLWETVGMWSVWERYYPLLADVPPYPLALFGMAVGILIVWAGWTKGGRLPAPTPMAA